ncbi:hypothetical protein [Streptomyces sp. NPDC056188]|uniref:type I restriction endonuclease subunit R, EcoR124 family n=1 Tax=Streptomyces sp. NPDC056188 TaxID=3345740 RepID=UPI0035DCD12C
MAPYREHFSKYQQKIAELLDCFPLGKGIVGEQAQKDFIALFGAILSLRNILVAFDEFAGDEILTPRQMQDYQSVYLDLYEDFRRTAEGDKESISEDVVFEIELVKQVEVGVDYILTLVSEYQKQKGNGVDKELEARENIAAPWMPARRCATRRTCSWSSSTPSLPTSTPPTPGRPTSPRRDTTSSSRSSPRRT